MINNDQRGNANTASAVKHGALLINARCCAMTRPQPQTIHNFNGVHHEERGYQHTSSGGTVESAGAWNPPDLPQKATASYGRMTRVSVEAGRPTRQPPPPDMSCVWRGAADMNSGFVWWHA